MEQPNTAQTTNIIRGEVKRMRTALASGPERQPVLGHVTQWKGVQHLSDLVVVVLLPGEAGKLDAVAE